MRKLVAEGEIATDATVVCVLTGNVLKDTDAITAYHLDGGADAKPGFGNARGATAFQWDKSFEFVRGSRTATRRKGLGGTVMPSSG